MNPKILYNMTRQEIVRYVKSQNYEILAYDGYSTALKTANKILTDYVEALKDVMHEQQKLTTAIHEHEFLRAALFDKYKSRLEQTEVRDDSMKEEDYECKQDRENLTEDC